MLILLMNSSLKVTLSVEVLTSNQSFSKFKLFISRKIVYFSNIGPKNYLKNYNGIVILII